LTPYNAAGSQTGALAAGKSAFDPPETEPEEPHKASKGKSVNLSFIV